MELPMNTLTAGFFPMVVEREAGDKTGYDLPSRLLKERIVFVTGVIEDHMATSICMQLLYCEADIRTKRYPCTSTRLAAW